MQKFTLPAGTTNRHQWHKPAAKAVRGVTNTFDMVRELWGTKGERERSSLVSHLSFGGNSERKNPDAVAMYKVLGERFNWTITKENAAEVVEAFTEILPKCMEAVTIEDHRTTPEQDNERHEQRAQQAQAQQVIADEKSGRVEELAEELRKQYPDAIGKDSGKSSQARAAANLKSILQAQGLRVSVKSSSFSGGDSVTAKVLTPDLPPERRKELGKLENLFTYGTFDAMTDSSGYNHSDEGEAWEQVNGRAKYCRIEFVQSDQCRADIREFLGHDDADPHSSQPHQVWSGAHCDAAQFWENREEPEPVAAAVATGAGFTIEKHRHTKKNFDFYLVVMADRVEREQFVTLRDSCKAAGGWYSRKWGGSPGGFAFKEREQAGAWAVQEFGGNDTPPPDKPISSPDVVKREDAETAERLRTLADKLTDQIAAKHGERQTNTPKRQRQAMSARIDGDRLARTQQALRAIADLHESGEVPEVLRKVSTKKAVFELVGTITNSTGYYHVGDTGNPSKDSPAARAVWALLKPKDAEQLAAEELADKVQGLQFSQIPGYFPTPSDLVEDMILKADIRAGQSVLEPSAGSGAITDQLADLHADPLIVVHESNHTLCEILRLKGFDARPGDFLESNGEFKFDRVVMNPPFEKLQDIDHVRHAFGKLKDGGRLVSIMSPGPFFRDDKKCREFRAWLEELNGEVEDIEAGTFKESGTGVASKLVVIDKPEAVAKVTPQVEALPGMTPRGIKTEQTEPVQACLF